MRLGEVSTEWTARHAGVPPVIGFVGGAQLCGSLGPHLKIAVFR